MGCPYSQQPQRLTELLLEAFDLLRQMHAEAKTPAYYLPLRRLLHNVLLSLPTEKDL